MPSPSCSSASIVQPFIAAMQALALVFLCLKAPGSTGRLAAAPAVRLAGAVRRLGAGPLPVRQGERSGLSPGDLRAAVLLRHRAGGMKALHIACGHRACRADRSAGRAEPRPGARQAGPGGQRLAAGLPRLSRASRGQAAPKRAGLCAGAVDALLYIGEVLEPDYPLLRAAADAAAARSSRPSSRTSRRCARKSIARISRAWCWRSCASTGRAANDIAAPRTGDRG